MGLTNIIGVEASSHWFHALALAGQQQASAIGLQRNGTIAMPRGLRQAIKVGREAFLLGAWRWRVGAHGPNLARAHPGRPKKFSSTYLVYVESRTGAVAGASRWPLVRLSPRRLNPV